MKTSRVIAGILVAAAVGAAVGVAFAPDKGSKTRKKLKRQVDDLSDNARQLATDAKEKTIAKAAGIYEQGKKEVNKLVNKVSGHDVEVA
jgi:gas vesicle protein